MFRLPLAPLAGALITAAAINTGAVASADHLRPRINVHVTVGERGPDTRVRTRGGNFVSVNVDQPDGAAGRALAALPLWPGSRAILRQTGDDNTATIRQHGDNKLAVVMQRGNGTDVVVDQRGEGPGAAFVYGW